MGKPRHGDYHLAETHRVVDAADNFKGYVATCDACGWVGDTRPEKGAAEDDAAAHDIAENDGVT